MHPIKRAALVLFLSLGAIGGFTHGFAHLACHGGGCAAESRRDQFEEHIADVCTRSAQRVYDEQQAREDARPHHHHHDRAQWGGPPPQYWGGPPPQYWGGPPAPAAAAPAPAPVADPAAVPPPAAE